LKYDCFSWFEFKSVDVEIKFNNSEKKNKIYYSGSTDTRAWSIYKSINQYIKTNVRSMIDFERTVYSIYFGTIYDFIVYPVSVIFCPSKYNYLEQSIRHKKKKRWLNLNWCNMKDCYDSSKLTLIVIDDVIILGVAQINRLNMYQFKIFYFKRNKQFYNYFIWCSVIIARWTNKWTFQVWSFSFNNSFLQIPVLV